MPLQSERGSHLLLLSMMHNDGLPFVNTRLFCVSSFGQRKESGNISFLNITTGHNREFDYSTERWKSDG